MGYVLGIDAGARHLVVRFAGGRPARTGRRGGLLAERNRPPAVEAASIAGYLVDARSGRPLAGAPVRLLAVDEEGRTREEPLGYTKAHGLVSWRVEAGRTPASEFRVHDPHRGFETASRCWSGTGRRRRRVARRMRPGGAAPRDWRTSSSR
jgi:hypothetical protein